MERVGVLLKISWMYELLRVNGFFFFTGRNTAAEKKCLSCVIDNALDQWTPTPGLQPITGSVWYRAAKKE